MTRPRVSARACVGVPGGAQGERDRAPWSVLDDPPGGPVYSRLRGGPARAAKMTKEERSESARKAARARWDKKRREEESS